MEKIEVNALGKPCPLPVIETKKAIRQLGDTGGQVTVLVDNDVAVKNVTKMVNANHYQIDAQPVGENFQLAITVTQPMATQEPHAGLVIAFGRNVLGEGDPKLGQILLKSYIYSLTELDTPPEHLLFFNSGAHLTSQDSGVLDDLHTLEDKGSQISTCGTCLDFYNIKDQLAIGEITNMYAIVEAMDQAGKVVTI
ncbi:sulfurtransferase-like selenium metabolism protein YedF [Loigolactobacillus jiayinensis]|uniref:Sulfurtransferase-like selenium metabolism protein YedF n=1 Tax=Loigolactobacillus jiayinensis TaxID=2486016 RepID=A0ABW1RAY0_9LACO|nr:sulfurtransferase-like selenium metabolism protein YedF [Loigolactobacillus jiayinensis]